jgi:hypothetical protein
VGRKEAGDQSPHGSSLAGLVTVVVAGPCLLMILNYSTLLIKYPTMQKKKTLAKI